MSKIFVAVFLIFGTVVGSGFSSGKEIYVFFSRFGALSYFFVALAAICFYFLFRFLLSQGSSMVEKFEKSNVFCCALAFVSLIFCSSMFAGIENLFSFSLYFRILVVLIVSFACLFVAYNGMKSLEKVNMVLMPIAASLFLVVLAVLAMGTDVQTSGVDFVGLLYSPLYVALNTSMSVFVFSKIGKTLSKKQANTACFLATILIFIFLTLGNFVLLNADDVYGQEMPFLSLTKDDPILFYCMFFVILSGCFTTLISLCYTLNCMIRKVIKNPIISAVISVIAPLIISLLGFSQIVTMLYPLCSVISIFALIFVLFQRE